MAVGKDGLPVIPPVPAGVDAQTRQWMTALKEALEVRTGQRGDTLDRSPTVRELAAAGLLVPVKNGIPVDAKAVSHAGVGKDIRAAVEVDFNQENPAADITPPLAPTSLETVGTENFIVLSWEGIDALKVSQTQVYVNETNDRESARLAATVGGKVFGYTPPVVGETYYFWVRFLSFANVVGPFHDVQGVEGTTDANTPDDVTVNTLTAAHAIIGEGEIHSLAIGDIIQSDNYVPGKSGWAIKK